MVGIYRAHSLLPVSLREGAVQWSGLLCPSVGLAISYSAGGSLPQKGGPSTEHILEKSAAGHSHFFLSIYQKQAPK